MKSPVKIIAIVFAVIVVCCGIFIAVILSSDDETSTNTDETTIFAASAAVSVEDLPANISTIVQSYNKVNSNGKQIGIDAPIYQLPDNNYLCKIDLSSFNFSELKSKNGVSIRITSSADTPDKREKALNDSYFILMILFADEFDDAENFIAWKSITSGQRFEQDGVSLEYISGDSSDILTVLVPNDKISLLN